MLKNLPLNALYSIESLLISATAAMVAGALYVAALTIFGVEPSNPGGLISAGIGYVVGYVGFIFYAASKK